MQTRTAILPWLWEYLRPHRPRVLLALLALAVGSASWLVLGQGVRLLVDEGFLSGDPAALNRLMLLVLLINLVGAVAVFVRFYLMTWLGERVSADLRKAVFDHLLQLPPSFFAEQRTGEVISRFTADTTVLQTVVGMSLSMALRSALTLVGGGVMMAITSWQLTLAVAVAVPVVLGPILFFGRRVRRLSKDSQDRVADLGARVDETLHEIQTVQAYGHEPLDNRAFRADVESVMATAVRRIRYRSGLIAAVMLLSVTAITLVSWMGALEVMAGGLSAGQLTAFMFYAVLVAGAVATLSEVIGEIMRAAGATERLRELMTVTPAIVAPQAPKPLPMPLRGALQFDDVSFAYPMAPDQPVLKALSLSIKPGERVALVGPSGAGKTTLFQLLKLFYRPDQGQVLLDGVSSHECDPVQWRRQFAMVSQEPVIFADSVLENVRYGRPDASEAEVEQACRAARAHEFVATLPQGYHTHLGERGVRLSGGQKQRIAIARALLADRPILLLDEATSALDAANEAAVQAGLEQLMAGRTTLVIAHRLATVVNADRLVVLEQGEIRAIGDHRSLLQSSPLYRQLAELQLMADPQENLSS
ncbi:lipid A ABC exporter family, fused ATPase and inner membrane subunits [Ferrimonas balearica DSM 9799]|uniref:Lipid A ABC exporter family, fused ATPase and inner membrane subunits n=1 Tax=Ferrimonas balearica (strain DSM 9799 / CCM 4581 / KCTC 23876 / PAT) TaxID=550540 RepID=E1SVR1_FERBD|nr:ABC transporter transmembrane domain-containing protein [Ferrimonas balearica]ADN76392.1 lipid A ABC exporter family, fused ATPase and inner membrane subunits [Ferrimonas balearica DSM 9799]